MRLDAYWDPKGSDPMTFEEVAGYSPYSFRNIYDRHGFPLSASRIRYLQKSIAMHDALTYNEVLDLCSVWAWVGWFDEKAFDDVVHELDRIYEGEDLVARTGVPVSGLPAVLVVEWLHALDVLDDGEFEEMYGVVSQQTAIGVV